MKEFDICIRTPPEGDIIVYMLPYHTYLKLESLRIVLDASLRVIVRDRIALNAVLNRHSGRSFASMSGSLGVKTGGRAISSLLTRTGEPILTRSGVEIEEITISDTLPITATKTVTTQTLRVAIISDAGVTAFKYFTVPLKTALDIGVEHPVVSSYAYAAAEIGMDAGGMRVLSICTRNGVELLTRDGDDIGAIVVSKTVFVSETKAVSPEHTAIDIGPGGISSAALQTNACEDLFTQDGESIDAVEKSKSVSLYETKTFSPEEASIHVGIGGVAFDPLLTDSGEELISQNGERIDAVSITREIRLSEIKTVSPEQNPIGIVTEDISMAETKTVSPEDASVRLNAGGVYSGSLLTRNDSELLTQDGESIDAVEISETVYTYISKAIVLEACEISMRAGGASTDYLLTGDGTRIETQDGDELFGEQTLYGVPLYYRTDIGAAGGVSIQASIELLASQYRKLSNLDGSSLQSVDSMTLEDIDHIIT